MNKIEANWTCSNCQTINYLTYILEELEFKIHACCSCGKVHGGFKVQDKKNQSWLNCLPYKGIGSTLPTGANQDPATGEILWGDPNSSGHLNPLQFAQKYGWDPWTIWCRLPRNRGNPICKGYDDRCKKKASRKAEDLSKELDQISDIPRPKIT